MLGKTELKWAELAVQIRIDPRNADKYGIAADRQKHGTKSIVERILPG